MNTAAPAPRRRDPIAIAALLVAMLALVFSVTGAAPAERQPRAGAGARALTRQLAKLRATCPVANGIRFGSWCLESSPHPIPDDAVGQNDYFYASRICVREGGWLPTAAQLIGAASKAPLQSTIDDDPTTSGTEEFPDRSRGIKDKREMTSDLFTTTAGSEAAGSEGVTAGSRGAAAQGEPDPVPMPANPAPETLNYVTVYDNHNQGGFAGGEPVGKAETFRCAYAIGYQGKAKKTKGT